MNAQSAPAPGPGQGYVAVDVQMLVELSQETVGGPFSASLIRQESRWFDDDPNPDVIESIVCETQLTDPLPTVFGSVNHWLQDEHRLRTLPHTWQPGNTGPGSGLIVLLQGRAVPVRPTGQHQDPPLFIGLRPHIARRQSA